jgi:murein DD-endopeptidase MepM/ murein hydrolase activator NlpD
MAIATTRDQSKSGFIKQVLLENPYANVKAVNEAWRDAGKEGSISPALVNKLRYEAGLAGNLRDRGKAETTVAAKTEEPKSTGKKRGRKPLAQGKTPFIKEFLNDNPQASTRAVNEAWQAAGFDGTISHTLVSQMRAQLGLRGKPGKTKAASQTKPFTGKKRGRKPKGTSPCPGMP